MLRSFNSAFRLLNGLKCVFVCKVQARVKCLGEDPHVCAEGEYNLSRELLFLAPHNRTVSPERASLQQYSFRYSVVSENVRQN